MLILLTFCKQPLLNCISIIAAEVEGEAQGEAPAGANLDDAEASALLDIDFDDGMVCIFSMHGYRINIKFSEDVTNMQRHAKKNAQDAIALAKRKAQDFDTQAALERKTNEALKLAKAQAHIRDESVEGVDASTTPLVDREYLNSLPFLGPS